MCWRLSGKAALAAGLRRLCRRSLISHAGLAVFLKHGLECIAAILLFSFSSFALCAPAGPECATKASIEYSTKLQYLSDGKLVYGSFAHMLADDDSPPHAINVATSINGSPDTLFASAVGSLHDLAVDVRNRPNNNKYAWLSDEIGANIPLIDQPKNTADYAHLESMVAKVYPSSDHISTKTLPIEDISSVAGTRSGNAPVGTLNSPIIWNGSVSSDWAIGANWTGGMAPTALDEVVIDGNYTNAPVLDLASGAITISSLTLGENNTSLLTISNGDTDTKKLVITNDVTIGGSGTLTHTANSTTEQHKLFLEVGGDMTIKSGGVIDVNEKGYATEQGHGAGGSASKNGSGAGHGGNGGLGGTSPSFAGTPYGSLTPPIANGSGGGKSMYSGAPGGSGGGVIYLLVSGTVTNEGSILANGGNGEASLGYSGGGGSGGSIYINTHTLEGAGTIAVNGGNGGTGNNHRDGGGGGGGRIALHYDTDNSTFATLSAYGGSGPGNAQSGGAGTIVTKASTDTNGHLLVDNNNQSDGALTTTAQSETVNSITVQNQGKFHIAVSHTITNTGSISGNASIYNSGIYNHPSPTLTIPTGLTWYENGTDPHIGDTQPITDIIIDGTLEFQNQNTDITPTSFNSITINNGGILTHQANTNTQTDALNLDLDDLTINQGGKIDVSGKGYDVSQGPGKGIDNSSVSSGAGHGGDGGNSSSGVAGGAAYGSVNEPITIGSGGGISSSSARTGRGGGAIKLIITNAIAIEGIIDASGLNGSGGRSDGGGAGGSVWITTASISGSGSIIANGGNGSHSVYGDGGGGGGGRIALHYDTDNSTFATLSAYGGSGPGNAQSGGAGTIVTKASTDTNGHLLVDNNNQSDGALTTTAQSETVNSITVQNQGKFHIAVSHTITNTGSISGNASIYNSGIYNHPSPTLTIPTGLTWYENGTDPHIGDTQPITDIIIDGTLEFQNQNTDITPTSFNSITINNGGILTHQANTNTQTDALNLDLDDLTINQGGKIDVSGKGYDVSQGPGKGIDNSSVSSGAGHGGDGGNSSSGVAGGAAYGSVNEPITIGSGGGISSSSARTGRGGGAIKLIITNAIAIEGIIDASGLNGSGGRSDGGGAGGSVWITTASISGSGSIIANGGNGSHSVYGDGGGGGGGRIALHYDTDNSTFATLSAYGGSGPGNAQSGGAGTIVTKASTDTNGHLLVDNNNQSDGALTTTAQSETVNSITVQNQGKFHIAVSHTIRDYPLNCVNEDLLLHFINHFPGQR